MKVLHIVPSMNPKAGGVCQAVRSMVDGLRQLGVENEVVCLDAADASFLVNITFHIHALGPWQGRWIYSKKLVPWLLSNLSRFDKVIVHGMWQFHAYATHKAFRILKKKKGKSPQLFVMPHGMLDPYFQRASVRKLKVVRNWFYWKLIEGKVINKADGLLFTCETERQLASQPFKPYMPKHENVVGLGIETPPPYVAEMKEAFLNRCAKLHNNSYLLFLGRIDEKKGVKLLIEAYANVYANKHAMQQEQLQTYSHHCVPKLVIAGPGLETVYGVEVQQLVSGLSLQEQILFPGMLTSAAKWGAYYGCEAFVLSSHQENFGIAVVEALACGKPVLISNQINIASEIKNAGAGLVDADTIQGTTNLLMHWRETNENNRTAMAQNATQAFEKYFAVAPASAQLLQALSAA